MSAAISVSVLRRVNDRAVVPAAATWEELTAWESIETHDKKAVPLWSPIVWADHAKIVNARSVSPILVLDFDASPWSAVFDFLERCPARWHLHTTWKFVDFGDPSAKARVLVELSRALSPHEYPGFWAKAIRALGLEGLVDAACGGLDRAYFVPSHRPGVKPERGDGGSGVLDVDAILAMPGITAPPPAEAVPVPAGGLPVPRDALVSLAARLRRGSGERQALGHYLARVNKGEALAEPGSRDLILYRLAGVLAQEFPTADPDVLARHFGPSLAASGDAPPTVAQVADKIRRRQRERAEALQGQAEDLTARIAQAFGGGRSTPYTPEELEAFGDMRHRWILSDGVTAWFFVGGEYRPARLASLLSAARTYLAPAVSAGVSLTRMVRGELVDKDPNSLLREYGQIVSAAEHDLITTGTTYDLGRGVLTIGHGPRRQITPREHPEIGEWLALLCGDQIEFVLDWLAVVRKLDQPAPGLLMYGESGVGKNLLAAGLARFWTESGPTALESVMTDGFNESILHCPILYGDEQIPRGHGGRPRTEELRRLVSADAFPLRQKYVADSRITGAVRVVIGVQRLESIFSDADLTDEDIRAIGDRFVVVKADGKARAWLRSRGGRQKTGPWVSEDLIAEHVAWLEATRRPTLGERLIVPGNAGELVRHLRVDSGPRWAILFWIYSYLRRPEMHDRRVGGEDAPAILVVPTEFRGAPWAIAVNAQRLAQSWAHYLPESARPPALEKLVHAIREISEASGTRYRGRSYRLIDPSALTDWTIAQEEDLELVARIFEVGVDLARSERAPDSVPIS